MDLQSEIKQLLEARSKDIVNKDGAFCTGFFLAAEFFDSNGDYYSFSIKDESMPPWRVEGLVTYEVASQYLEEESEDYG
jgi:hypothetical protein